MTDDLFIASKRTEYDALVTQRDKALRRHEKHRASVLQRRIKALLHEILEHETGKRRAA